MNFMKNFALKFSFFALSIFIFCAVKVSAQMCGKFKETIIVQDEKGKPIDTAVVQFLPITKDETRGKQFTRSETDRSAFEIEYQEGHSVKEFHKLIVSADGYKTAENEMKFYSCQRLRVIVKLPKNDSSKSPVWEFDNEVAVAIKDENDKGINGVKVSILKDGKVLRSIKPDFDSAGFSEKTGEYIFRLEKDGYQTEDIKVDLTKIGNVRIETKLKLKN